MSAADEAALCSKLREAVGEQAGESESDLLRFLRARKHKLEPAARQLLAWREWRKSERIDAIQDEAPGPHLRRHEAITPKWQRRVASCVWLCPGLLPSFSFCMHMKHVDTRYKTGRRRVLELLDTVGSRNFSETHDLHKES
jgi:hypothetical protein